MDFDAEFSKLIVNTQLLAQKDIALINKRESENETLSKSRINASALLKQFSNAYNELKESFSVSENINNAILQFLDTAYKLSKTLNSIPECAKFFKFIIEELNNVARVKAKESMPKYS